MVLLLGTVMIMIRDPLYTELWKVPSIVITGRITLKLNSNLEYFGSIAKQYTLSFSVIRMSEDSPLNISFLK